MEKMRLEHQCWAVTGKPSTYHPMTLLIPSVASEKMISLNGPYIYFYFQRIMLLYVSKHINTNDLFPETGLERRLVHELAEPDGCK